MDLIAGFGLAVLWANPTQMLAGMSVEGVPTAVVQTVPVRTITSSNNRDTRINPGMGYIHRVLVPKYWTSNAAVWNNWKDRYDGPSLDDCRTVLESDYLYIKAQTVCVKADGVTIPWTKLDTQWCTCGDDGWCTYDEHGCDQCVSSPDDPDVYCARHVPLAQLGSFAGAGAKRAMCFLNHTLGLGPCPSSAAAAQLRYYGYTTYPARVAACAQKNGRQMM